MPRLFAFFLLALVLPAQTPPKGYVCYRAAGPLQIDGRIDAQWDHAPWTSLFVDIEGDAKPRPRFKTRARMLWDDQYFYIAAELEEPHVWGTLTQHDSVIFHDNDFELFVDPNSDSHEYFEFEMNALNATWDLFLPKPYKDGGSADNGWEIPGLRTAVQVDGTLNNPADTDKGWTLEIAIPWKAFGAAARRPLPPANGDMWRVNFSRVEWRHEIVDGKYRRVPKTKEDNWVWSPQGKVNMHLPEYWGYVRFSAKESGPEPTPADPTWNTRMRLQAYYEQQAGFRRKNKRWASPAELPASPGLRVTQPAAGQWRACMEGLCIRWDAKIETD
ncbi:MAG TPA: carbohydrate-binding family 9-like protein [Bryobacteraceae bacterium]|nr:carbohydrate-binding family 9-like protein [Bryobacteraceae bacterium]